MKFLIVKSLSLSTLIPSGHKYLAQGPIFICAWPALLLYVRYRVSHPYTININIIVLYIVIFKFLERSRKTKVFGPNNMNFDIHI